MSSNASPSSDQKTSDNTTDTHRHRIPTVKGQKRIRPAWSDWNFEVDATAPKMQPCAWCGKEAIPMAHTTTGVANSRKYFCSNAHGKLYLRAKQEKSA